MAGETSEQRPMDSQTENALERAARRMEWMRSVKRRATVAAIAGWAFTAVALVVMFGERYPRVAEYAFPLGSIGAIAVFWAALWLMVKLEG